MHHSQKLLSAINIYPIKSTAGLALEESLVQAEGLAHDRRWAIIDSNNAIITPRECPQLLTIQTSIADDALHIMLPDASSLFVPLKPTSRNLLAVTVFDIPVYGNHLSQSDQFLSAYLGSACRLIFMDRDCVRHMKPIHGGTAPVSYADSAPLLLTTLATFDALNNRLPRLISMKNFRPNLVLSGCIAEEEYGWKEISMGEVRFKVSEACKRCVVTTLDPLTTRASADQEPLRTLAAYERHPRGGVRFGINLIPQNSGMVRQGDEIKIVRQ